MLNNVQKDEAGIIKPLFSDKTNIQGDDNKENEPEKLMRHLESSEAVLKLESIITKLQIQLREKDSKINFLNQKILEIGKSLYEHEKKSKTLEMMKRDEQTDPMTPPKLDERGPLQMKLALQSDEINHLRSALTEAETRVSEQKASIDTHHTRIHTAKLAYTRLNGIIRSYKEEVRLLTEENENLRNTCQILTKVNSIV